MYKLYFKQAVQMLKQNKFISIITIIGTALAIMMIMVIVVTDAIKNVDVAPEINRDRTMYVKNAVKNHKRDQWMQSNRVEFELYKNYLSDLKTPEYTSAVNFSWDKFTMAKINNSTERFLSNIKAVDASFWKIMSFNFVDGRPFTQQEFNSEMLCAVITETLAKKVFGNENAVGKDIEIDFKEYKVTGVVKDVSEALQYAYGEAFIPYNTKNGYEGHPYVILFLIKDKKDIPLLEEEVRAAERKFNAADDDWNVELWGPYNHRIHQLEHEAFTSNPDTKKANRKMIFIFAILLLIPAVNLSSFSLSQVNRRSEEIGVRKAFGAKKYIILIQILFENFITSLIGGIIGLVLSYGIVAWLKEWLLDVGAESNIPVAALISIPVFISVFLACFLLNLLSAGIPAYLASKKSIVDSINQKISNS